MQLHWSSGAAGERAGRCHSDNNRHTNTHPHTHTHTDELYVHKLTHMHSEKWENTTHQAHTQYTHNGRKRLANTLMHIQTHTHSHREVYMHLPTNRCTFTPISIHFTHIFTHFMYLQALFPPSSFTYAPSPFKTPPLSLPVDCVKVMIVGCESGGDKPVPIVTCMIASIDLQRGMSCTWDYLPASRRTPPLPVRVCPCIVLESCRERPCLTFFDWKGARQIKSL